MKAPAVVVQRTAWLFTRGDASVSMTVETTPDGVCLIVRGPGIAHASHDFPDMTRLAAFAEGQEQRLHDEGFQLQAVTERRSGRERREASRTGESDRRR